MKTHRTIGNNKPILIKDISIIVIILDSQLLYRELIITINKILLIIKKNINNNKYTILSLI